VVSVDENTNPIEKLIPFSAKDIEVKGIVKESNGVYTIAVESVKEIAPSAVYAVKALIKK
jgi:hypothetical protein